MRRLVRRASMLTALSGLLALSGIAVNGGASEASSALSPQITAALAAWSDFRVSAAQRPLVLIDGDNVNAPALGFSDANSIAIADANKLAFLDGAIVAPSSFPVGPKSADGLRLISPQAALAILRVPQSKGPPSTTQLIVTSVTLGTGIFETDRGRRTLPAWLFVFRGVLNPADVLAVSPRRIFLPPPRHLVTGATLDTTAMAGSATLARDQRTLTILTGGAPVGTGPCTASYSMSVGVSKAAVAVEVHVTPHDDSGSTGSGFAACALPAYPIHLTTNLPVALGHRVLVDAPTRTPMSVTEAP